MSKLNIKNPTETSPDRGGGHVGSDAGDVTVTSDVNEGTQRVVKGGGPYADCFYLFLCFMCIKQQQWRIIEEVRILG